MGRLLLVALVAAGGVGAAALGPPAERDRPHAPARHAGVAAPDGLLVLAVLSPERVMVADPRTGDIARRRLAGGTFCHGPVVAAGDRVILSGDGGRRPIARSLPLSLRGAGRSLGAASAYAPSETPGRVWLTRPGGSVDEAAADGRSPARSRLRLPHRSGLEAAAGDGLLVTTGRHGLRLRGGASGPVRLRGGWLIAARAALVASCRPDREGACRRIWLWHRGAVRAVDPPAGIRPHVLGRSALSPGGRRLAMPVRARGKDRVAVVDLASGAWHVVAGARLAGYRALAWSPSGTWLYFTGSRRRVLAWRTGTRRPVVLPIRAGGRVMSIATTVRGAHPTARASARAPRRR